MATHPRRGVRECSWYGRARGRALGNGFRIDGSPLSIKLNRNGSKELIEWRNQSGDLHMRQLYDFQAHRLYNLDLAAKHCSIQEYVSAYAPLNFDPIGGADELRKEMAKHPPKIFRTEAINE